MGLALCVAVVTTPRVHAQDPATPQPQTTTPPTATPPAPTATAIAPTVVTPAPPVLPVPPARYDKAVDPAEMAADALVVRPVSLAATAVGAAIFVVALPFAAITGDVNRTAKTLIGGPANYTFKRKLGDFDDSL